MKRVLVTGSLGYLGSALSGHLEKYGYEVVGLDIGFFKDALLYPHQSTHTVFRDAREITAKDLVNIDAVVHLAGISNDPVGKLEASLVYDPTRSYSLSIAKLCKSKGIKFIFASSCSVYGLGSEELLTEDSDVNPQTFYSKNKIQIEEDLKTISDKSFSPIALRFATVFGLSPRIRFDVVINMFVGMAVTSRSIVLNSNGLSWRPNLHIQDACQAIRCAIELDHDSGELLVMNVGADENNQQIIGIAKIIQNLIPSCEINFLSEKPELDKGGLIRDRKVNNGQDTRTYRVSFGKIKKYMPDFKCEWDIEKGAGEMLSFFERLPLTSDRFRSRCFYRLQHLEDLHATGLISDELMMLNKG